MKSGLVSGILVAVLVLAHSASSAFAIDCTTLANDPYSTGCASNSFLVNQKGYNGHTVKLFYSTSCQTNWAEVTSSTSQSLKAIVEANTGSFCWFRFSPATRVWTNMVPCPDGSCLARACDLSAYYNDSTARGSKCAAAGCCTGWF